MTFEIKRIAFIMMCISAVLIISGTFMSAFGLFVAGNFYLSGLAFIASIFFAALLISQQE